VARKTAVIATVFCQDPVFDALAPDPDISLRDLSGSPLPDSHLDVHESQDKPRYGLQERFSPLGLCSDVKALLDANPTTHPRPITVVLGPIMTI
jgi:hypothetical protein